jgi:hypothetical protein
MIALSMSYYPMSVIGLNTSVKADEVSGKEGNPHHKKHEGHRCGERHRGDSEKKLMALAECAWKELLKEKIKANLEAKEGKRLDKVADVLVDAMIEKYKKMKECRKEGEELRRQLEDAFTME